MRYAILSDIHGNYEALKSVVHHIKLESIDHIINLGDFINYGPQSAEVIDFLRDSDIVSILGNHEYALLHEDRLPSFRRTAQLAFYITKQYLSDRHYTFIASLPKLLSKDNLFFIHGTPPDYIARYIFSLAPNEIRSIFDQMAASQFFVGHTHQQGLYYFKGLKFNKINLIPGELFNIDQIPKIIINVASVGQPRGENKDAHYVIYDSTKKTIQLKTVPYDIEKTVKLLKKRNFPKIYREILRRA